MRVALPPPKRLLRSARRSARRSAWWRVVVALAIVAAALTSLLPAASAATLRTEQASLARPEEGEVFRLYRAAFGREPDSGGFDYWVAKRLGGLPYHVVAENFLASREFALRFDADTDAEFVDVVYRNVLERSGDAEGVAYWLGALAAGLERSRLVLFFAESVEFRAQTASALSAFPPAAVPEAPVPPAEPSPDATSTEPPASSPALEPLPPFFALLSAVDAEDVPASWRPGCPVPLEELRTVKLRFVGFDGLHRRGTLIVHESVAVEVVAVFNRLYEARFPIERMQPIDDFGGDDNASMAANNTSAFNCRAVTGGSGWSRHAFGTAIDINPAQNPYVAGSTVLPPAGRDHLDRSRYETGRILPGDVVTEAFADAGWRWGGDFTTVADYQHFER